MHPIHTPRPSKQQTNAQKTARYTESQDVLECLENMWPANKTAKPRTILHILSSLPAQNAKQAAAARDASWQHPDFPHAHKKPNKTADIRNQQVEVKQVANPRRYETGYAQYTKAVKLTGQRLLDTMHDLYTLYSHTEDTITAVTGITHNTAHSGKGKKRRKKGETYQQYAVQWAPVVQPYWVVQAALALNYNIKGAVVAVAPESEPTVGTCRPCEFCKQQVDHVEQDVHTCSVCSRAYHAGCLPCRNAKRGAPHACSNTYTCEECIKENYTKDTLPKELRLVKVEWAEALEPRPTVEKSATWPTPQLRRGQWPWTAGMKANLVTQHASTPSTEQN